MSKKKFGTVLRAHRLGFHEMEPLGFVRISAEGPPWIVDVCPFDKLPRATSRGMHTCWWESSVAPIAAVIMAALQTPLTEQITIELDDDGKLIVPEKVAGAYNSGKGV